LVASAIANPSNSSCIYAINSGSDKPAAVKTLTAILPNVSAICVRFDVLDRLNKTPLSASSPLRSQSCILHCRSPTTAMRSGLSVSAFLGVVTFDIEFA
jgi:hypothetical protein